ncbi:YihY/virulence factor BrkB family protein [Leptolyngbya sp. 7M]|uniref:YihY/virulence factor BrkB family protein n=1 Tax=Leptolyngbya sp. 7M TaxID=2812896 RepID=UPI001B8B9190|nr:YihY/virulence factor BrkB family protein [Leptolyngbya sp. 7M]QYO66630.1 YihY/virulence factor BrkB family protein [Leptolyngbya sp. 7M]
MASIRDLQWKEFFLKLYEESFEVDIFSRAAQVAFYFSFSLFPLLFFLVSLFGLILESTGELKQELFEYLRQLLPWSAFVLVRDTVNEITEGSTTGKLTLGLAIMLWSASAGIDSVRNALNSIFHLTETRTWFRTKGESLLLTLVLIILIALILGIVFYGWQLVRISLGGIGLDVNSPWILVAIQWISVLLLLLLACEIFYNLLPNFKKRRWLWITPGTVVAIILWLLLTNGFKLYLQYFNTYNRAYGSLGAVIILMLWLYLTAVALLVGGTINSVLIAMREGSRSDEAKPNKIV